MFTVFISGYALPSFAEDLVNVSPEVVTGSRLYTNLDELPAPAYVLTRKEIEKSGASTLSQLLSKVPGISNKSRAGSTQDDFIEIRGLTTELLFLIDGVPYYKTSHAAGASAVDLRSLPLMDIERVEIVKGAGSAVYGSMAAAGVINIITRKPQSEEYKISATGGTYERKEGSLSVSIPGEKVNYGIWYSHREEGESPLLQYINSSGIFEDKNLDYEDDAGGFSLNSGPFDFSATWGEFSSEWTYGGDLQKQDNDYNRLSLVWNGDVSRFVIYRDKQEKNLDQEGFFGGKTDVEDTAWGAEFYKKSFWQNALVSWGMAFRHEDMTYKYIPKIGDTSYYDRTRKNYAPFVEVSLPLVSLIADFGLRYEMWDQNDADDYDELIPKLSLSYETLGGGLWYLSAGRFFAMPSLYELSYSYGSAEPNLSLNPEKGWSYELGYKKDLDKGSWNLGVFYLDMEDKIDWFTVSKNSYDGYYNNISEFRSWGVESLRTWNLSRQWDLSLGLTWMNAEQRQASNDPWSNARIPTWDIDGTALYTSGPFQGSLTVSYLGDRKTLDTDGPGVRGDVTTVDASISYDTDFGVFRLEGYNIFDKEFFVQDAGWGKYYGPEARYYLTWEHRF